MKPSPQSELFAQKDDTVIPRIQETDFPILGSNVSFTLEYFSNSRLKFLNSFLRYGTKLKSLQIGNLERLYATGIQFALVFKRTMFFCSLFVTIEC